MTSAQRERILSRMAEQFMVPEIYRGDVWEVSANSGETHYVPADIFSRSDSVPDLTNYVDGIIDCDRDTGEPMVTLLKAQWLARLSAPGYMDCTDWCAFGTRKEAEEYLIEMYGDDLDMDDDDDDDEQPEA